MKKLLIVVFVFVIALNISKAQNIYHPWIFGASTNYADFNSVDLKFTDQLTHARWMGKHMPTQLKIGRMLSSSFVVCAELSTITLEPAKMNEIPTKFPVTSNYFWRAGTQIEYKFANGYLLKEACRIDPYIFAGANASSINETTYITQSTGIGLNVWITDYFGVNAEGSYDFILDWNDYFHYSAGLIVRFENMLDKDRDRIPNRYDFCPEIPGLDEFHGCPDYDNDGVVDSLDKCPRDYGVPESNGCPDFDRDGIADSKDLCPCEPGKPELNGCPDTDGDGVVDKDDECPEEIGSQKGNGCPDSDADGIPDKYDACKTEPGTVEFGGCPKNHVFSSNVIIPQETESKLNFNAKNVLFESSEDVILDESYPSLNNILKIMNDYPQSRFSINGYTDNTGLDERNRDLSLRRAKSVMNYFTSKGIAANRLEIKGFGSANPIATNETEEGKKANRRVEIKVLNK